LRTGLILLEWLASYVSSEQRIRHPENGKRIPNANEFQTIRRRSPASDPVFLAKAAMFLQYPRDEHWNWSQAKTQTL
jgi:hypothetical protein